MQYDWRSLSSTELSKHTNPYTVDTRELAKQIVIAVT